MRFHRLLPLVVLLVISSSPVFTQTVIRERVEIEPKRVESSPMFSMSGSTLLRPNHNSTTALLTHPGTRVVVNSVDVNVPILTSPNNNVAGLYIEFWADGPGSGSFSLKRHWVCEGVVHETNFPLPEVNLTGCGEVYVLYKVTSWSGFGRCNIRDGAYKFAQASVTGSGVTFTIQDTVFNQFSIPVPVSATVTVSANALPGFELATVTTIPNKQELLCTETATVNVMAKNGNGQPLTFCSGTTLPVTASLEGVGPYAYLRQGALEGSSINFSMTTASSSFEVVLDTSRGVIPLGLQVATLRTIVDGVETDTTITLRCDYPPPGVTITYPGQDTTIILTTENQPIITLQEEHSPTSGQFEPSISWDPSQTINTAEYYDQIDDSLVIEVTATATNVAQMQSTATRKITLKVQSCTLVEFASSELSPGDTTLLTFKKVTDEGQEDFPAGKLFDVFIENPSNSGLLLSSTGATGATLVGVAAPVYYIAPDSLAGDSLVVSVRAVTSVTEPSARMVNVESGVAAIRMRKVGAEENKQAEVEREARLKAYELQLYALAAELCPLPSQVVVRGGLILRIVSIDATELWPYLPYQTNGDSRGADRPGYDADAQIIIELVDNIGDPVAGKTIKFDSQIVTAEGHLHTTVTLPKNKQGLFQKGSLSGNPLFLQTDAMGRVAIDAYQVSQVAGTFRIVASLNGSPTVMAEEEITVQVPGLVDFSQIQTNIWNLTGDVPGLHTDNHWCTPKMLDSLSAAVVDFYSWSGSSAGGGQFVVIDINDMSLPWGGAFDNNGLWNFNSNHSFHRVGLSVDINREPGSLRFDNGVLTRRGRQLEEIINQYGGKRYPEKTIHFGFDGGH